MQLLPRTISIFDIWIIHAGSRVSKFDFQKRFKLMEKYPGTCPQNFQDPDESLVLSSKDNLLPALKEEDEDNVPEIHPRKLLITNSLSDEDDIKPIKGVRDFFREFTVESKKLWYLAGPAIFTSICQYSIGGVTQIFVGQLGTIELAAFSIENSVIASFSYGIMLGMGSALETLCGQAFGAGQTHMLGIYMQRSWIILNSTAILVMFVYIFASPLLKLIHQDPKISDAAGKFARWMIPQLFAYAFNFPIAKFLQSQSKMVAMAVISAVTLAFHSFFSWMLIMKLGWGMVGAAVVLNASWWFIVVAQLLYIMNGSCGEAWSGFSRKAFENLVGFVRLSLASAVMLCLEIWYYTALVLFSGYLKNAEVAVDAFSICMNMISWIIMEAVGFSAAVGVRVSNELGAKHPRAAKFSVVVVGITSLFIGFLLALVVVITRDHYPDLFSNTSKVKELVRDLTPLLAVSMIINNVQPAISGVAIGAGWQTAVAYVSILSYYVFGIPLGLIMSHVLHMGLKGNWYGMMTGTVVQTLVLCWMVYKTNWNKEASMARERIKKWGGNAEETESGVERACSKTENQMQNNLSISDNLD